MALVSQDDSFENFSDHDSVGSKEKDATELELEKLVFGDELGFYDSLKSTNSAAVPGARKHVESPIDDDADKLTEEGLEGIDDADVRTRAIYT